MIEFNKWVPDKEALMPWTIFYGYNLIDSAFEPLKGVRACGGWRCKIFLEVWEEGLGNVQSNLKKHVELYLPSKLKKSDDCHKYESPDGWGKSKPLQYEF